MDVVTISVRTAVQSVHITNVTLAEDKSYVLYFPGMAARNGPGPSHFEATRSQSFRHITLGRISSSQRPLPDNTQHSQQTDVHVSAGFEPAILRAGGRSSLP
jgi:hypothetical protein